MEKANLVPHLSHVDAPRWQVAFVADHHHGHLLRVLHPLDLLSVLSDVLKGLGIVDGKDDEETFPSSHVLVSHGAVLLWKKFQLSFCSLQLCLLRHNIALDEGTSLEFQVKQFLLDISTTTSQNALPPDQLCPRYQAGTFLHLSPPSAQVNIVFLMKGSANGRKF